MHKILLGLCCLVTFVFAQTELSILGGKKEYTNSKTKQDGKVYRVDLTHKESFGNISLGMQKDRVNREHPISKQTIEKLKVEKYNALYEHIISPKLAIKGSFIKIIDNLAPTDQGKIYGIGTTYKFPKGFGTKLDFYRSDYEQFNVNQYDVTLYKGFKIAEAKAKIAIVGKSIHIDGKQYGNYQFDDTNYFTTGIKLAVNYHDYTFKTATFLGKRVFTVLNGGQSVQHHAMELDKSYVIALEKKFNDFKVVGKYLYQNGKELPENQEDVDTEIFSVALHYKF